MLTWIPVIEETDVLIVGDSTGAVAAALAARRAGARVFVAASRTYLGGDVCATARYWLDADQAPGSPLAEAVFAGALKSRRPVRPMHVKYCLEQALLKDEIAFLYMTYPVCLLRGDDGGVSGLVVVNRSGYQAIRAGVIIDATERALVARMTPATFAPLPAGRYVFERVVVGGPPVDAPEGESYRLEGDIDIDGRPCPGTAYHLAFPLPADAGPADFGRVELQARLRTWHPKQLFASDRLFFASPDRLRSGQAIATWRGPTAMAEAAFRCGPDPVFALGNAADLSDGAAAELMKPCNLMAVGTWLGTQAAAHVSDRRAAALHPDYRGIGDVMDCDVRRRNDYFRLDDAARIGLELNRLPVLGQYDVVVAGGGTAGAPAGIAAGRAGAKPVVLEYLAGLGGVSTEGRIARYYHGNRCGFTTELDRGVHAMGPDPEFAWDAGSWNTEWKKQWYIRELATAGAEVWFGALVAAATVAGDRVTGVAVATPYGYGLVRGRCTVDASGNADVAAAAGAPVVNISKAHVAVQGTGVAPLTPGTHYQNTDHTFVDDTDVMDVTRAFAVTREKLRACFDMAQIIDSRQRQQVEGELSLAPLDFLAGRTFSDTVVTSRSNFDSHGFTIHPVFMAKPPDRESLEAHVPLRCLLPKGLEDVLVTGLGVSAHRDALPVIRMQPDVQNQGYAAGRAAAMAAASGAALRMLDIKALQRHLVEMAILAPDVLAHEDSFPVDAAAIAAAAATGIDDYRGLAILFGHVAASRPLLRQAYAQTDDEELRARYAHILGLMGDDAGVATLIAAVDGCDWDVGWDFTGMGQFGFSLSTLDSRLVALGRSGNPAAIPALLRKAEALSPDAAFSHFRALTLAFEAQPTPAAIAHFVRFLEQVRGHAHARIADALTHVPEGCTDTSERNAELKELLLARGLYACGDSDGKAEAVLRAYSKDLHGHYARHARAILKRSDADDR